MQFDVNTVNNILGIDESYKAPERMLELMLDNKQRPAIFKQFLKISTDMSFDWFHEYFEDEAAERKKKKQDFTPESIARLMVKIASHDVANGSYFEPAAGTGGILITKWWKDCLNDPVGNPLSKKKPELSILTYDPRNYWYEAEEMSDRAIPFLIFNMAIRGINGIVVQCNSLERTAKEVYFIRNDSDTFLGFSDVIKMPHTKVLEQELDIHEWVEKF